jgi:phosphatidylinositol glycan class N
VYRLVPIFSPFLMAALLVSIMLFFLSGLLPPHRPLNAVPCFYLNPQIFKIVAPFVFLSAAFATLNARLGMPPFALFLVALCLTDGTPAPPAPLEKSPLHVPTN